MKQPRISDFDPNAKERALKSPMDDFPAIEHHQQKEPASHIPNTVPPVLPVRPVRGIPSTPTPRRKIKSRHPFDIYEDQVDTLKELSLEDRRRGGAGSMSAMVREALDDYITKVRAE